MRLRGRHTHSLSTNRVVTNLCGNRLRNQCNSRDSSSQPIQQPQQQAPVNPIEVAAADMPQDDLPF